MTGPIRVEIAPGELIDRITILEIKAVAHPWQLSSAQPGR